MPIHFYGQITFYVNLDSELRTRLPHWPRTCDTAADVRRPTGAALFPPRFKTRPPLPLRAGVKTRHKTILSEKAADVTRPKRGAAGAQTFIRVGNGIHTTKRKDSHRLRKIFLPTRESRLSKNTKAHSEGVPDKYYSYDYILGIHSPEPIEQLQTEGRTNKWITVYSFSRNDNGN